MMRLTPLLLLGVSLPLAAQRPAKGAAPGKYPAAPAAAMAAIKEADLKRDLYAMAGDAMRGREAGSLDEMRASIWVAEQLRTIGVKPAGDDGTYFQWWNMRRTRVSTAASSVKSGGKTLELWKDVVPTGNAEGDGAGPVLFVGDGGDSTVDVRGKVAVVTMSAPPRPVLQEGTNTYEYRYATSAIQATTAKFRGRGAAAVIIIADSTADIAFDGYAAIRSRGTYDVEGGAPRFAPAAAGAAGEIGRASCRERV